MADYASVEAFIRANSGESLPSGVTASGRTYLVRGALSAVVVTVPAPSVLEVGASHTLLALSPSIV